MTANLATKAPFFGHTSPDVLRFRVLQTLRKHWVAPRLNAESPPVPAARIDETARAGVTGLNILPGFTFENIAVARLKVPSAEAA